MINNKLLLIVKRTSLGHIFIKFYLYKININYKLWELFAVILTYPVHSWFCVYTSNLHFDTRKCYIFDILHLANHITLSLEKDQGHKGKKICSMQSFTLFSSECLLLWTHFYSWGSIFMGYKPKFFWFVGILFRW